MIIFPSMLEEPAREAGIKVPDCDLDAEEYDHDKYPHWHFFCMVQLSRAVRYHGEQWENAKAVAKIPTPRLPCIGFDDLDGLGIVFK